MFSVADCYISASLSDVSFVACTAGKFVYFTFVMVFVLDLFIHFGLLCHCISCAICYVYARMLENVSYNPNCWAVVSKYSPFFVFFIYVEQIV